MVEQNKATTLKWGEALNTFIRSSKTPSPRHSLAKEKHLQRPSKQVTASLTQRLRQWIIKNQKPFPKVFLSAHKMTVLQGSQTSLKAL